MPATRSTLGLFVFACALPLCAQNFGEITGSVIDSSGGVAAGASITVTNGATNVTRRILTNSTGNYTVPFLVPGVYNVRADLQGFRPATRTEVQVQVGAVERVDFTLEVGQVSEAVEVKSSSVLLATESASVGTVVENRRIVELPLNGRNYLQLLSLSTNVTAEAGSSGSGTTKVGGDRSTQNFAIAGTRLQFNNFTLDGITNTDPNWNNYIFRPSIEAIQEFKVETGVYSVEYGRNPGQISVTTKAGTNQYHASVFEFLRNSALDAREWNQSTGAKNPFRRNQYGFTLGGRLIRDRLFFMTNFEGLRDSKTTQSVAAVATDRMRSGDFSLAGRSIFDPGTRVYTKDANGNPLAVSATQFPNNLIPATQLDSIAVKLLAFYPQATRPGDSIVGNYIRQGPHPTNEDQFTQRIDFNENSKSFWFGRFGWNDEFLRQTSTFANQEGKIATNSKQIMLSNTRTLSTAAVNEFRFGYTKFYNNLSTYSAGVQNPVAGLGIIGLNDPGPFSWGTPSVGLGNGLSGFGETADGPYVNQNHIFQWLDNLSMVRGRHSLKFGGDLRRDRLNQYGQVYLRGQFTFDGSATYNPANRSATGYSLADFLLGDMQQFVAAPAAATVQGRDFAYSLYAEDTWKVTPKLTLTFGLRYEVVPPPHDKYRSMMNMQMFDPGAGPAGILPGTRTPVLVRAGQGGIYDGMQVHFPDSYPTASGDEVLGGKALVRTDHNDFGPRIGLAYSPSTRWTVRAGFGVFYAHEITNPQIFDMARNLVPRVTIVTNTEVPNVPIGNPYVSQQGAATQCSNWSGICSPASTTFFVVDNNMRTPYLNQWILNVQRQFMQSMALEVGYVGNEGHKLERGRDYNAPIPRTSSADASTRAQRSPWPGIGILESRLGEANSNYNGLSAKLTQQFARGLMYLVSYTWSKAIDDGSAIRQSTNDYFATINPYNNVPERGLSAYDVRHRLSASFVYEMPVGRGKALLTHSRIIDATIGGWQLGSVVTLASGIPTSVATIPWNGDNTFTIHPDATGISPIPANRTASQFWNVQAFNWTDPGLLYRFGNVARNTLICPGTKSWDFSAIKNFRITERHALQFRFEAFNIPNHPNWNRPSSDPRSPSFGIVQSASTMRQLQFALKYSF